MVVLDAACSGALVLAGGDRSRVRRVWFVAGLMCSGARNGRRDREMRGSYAGVRARGVTRAHAQGTGSALL